VGAWLRLRLRLWLRLWLWPDNLVVAGYGGAGIIEHTDRGAGCGGLDGGFGIGGGDGEGWEGGESRGRLAWKRTELRGGEGTTMGASLRVEACIELPIVMVVVVVADRYVDAVVLADAGAILYLSNAPRTSLMAVEIVTKALQVATGHAVHKATFANCDAICETNATTNHSVSQASVVRSHTIYKSSSGSDTVARTTTAMT